MFYLGTTHFLNPIFQQLHGHNSRNLAHLNTETFAHATFSTVLSNGTKPLSDMYVQMQMQLQMQTEYQIDQKKPQYLHFYTTLCVYNLLFNILLTLSLTKRCHH